MIEWLLIAELANPQPKVVQRFQTEEACVAKLDDRPRGNETFTCVNSEDEKDFVLPMWRYKNCTQKAPYAGDKAFCGRERK
jgi:hypothetical protein